MRAAGGNLTGCTSIRPTASRYCTPALIRLQIRPGVDEFESTFPPGEGFAHLSLTTNSATATAAMMKAGAKQAATGENPVVVACRTADVILGPIGIVIADSLIGEVTPKMAVAVGQAQATRILIPMNKCDNLIAGVSSRSTATVIADAIEKLRALISE